MEKLEGDAGSDIAVILAGCACEEQGRAVDVCPPVHQFHPVRALVPAGEMVDGVDMCTRST